MSERVLITGSRSWTDRAKIRAEIEALPRDAIIVHGAHWEGADLITDQEAKKLGMKVEPHPAEWKTLGRRAGPLRNSEMVESKPDRYIAFRSPGKSNGTDDCVSKAKEAGIPGKTVTED